MEKEGDKRYWFSSVKTNFLPSVFCPLSNNEKMAWCVLKVIPICLQYSYDVIWNIIILRKYTLKWIFSSFLTIVYDRSAFFLFKGFSIIEVGKESKKKGIFRHCDNRIEGLPQNIHLLKSLCRADFYFQSIKTS